MVFVTDGPCVANDQCVCEPAMCEDDEIERLLMRRKQLILTIYYSYNIGWRDQLTMTRNDDEAWPIIS